MKISLVNIVRYEVFILVGFVMVVASLIKLSGMVDFSSDWFWLLAGVGLVFEGVIALTRQRRFDRKYKVIERDSED